MFATMTPFTPMPFAPRAAAAAPRAGGAGAGQQQRPSPSAAFFTSVASSIARTQVRATTPLFGAPATIAPPSFLQLATGSTATPPGFFVDLTTTTEETPAAIATTASSSKPNEPWDRTLVEITLPPIIHTKWANIPHPRDPRRQRAIERAREDFRNGWNAGNGGSRRPGVGDVKVESRGAPVIAGDNRDNRATFASSSWVKVEAGGSGERRDFPVWDSRKSFPSPESADGEELEEGEVKPISISEERERLRSRSIEERRKLGQRGRTWDPSTKNLFSKPVKVGLEGEKPEPTENGRGDERRRTRRKKKRKRRDLAVRDSTDTISSPSPVTFDAEKELEKRDSTRNDSSDEGDRRRSCDSEKRDRRRSGSSEDRERRRSGSSEERERRRSGSRKRRIRSRSSSSRKKRIRSRSGGRKKRIRSRSGSRKKRIRSRSGSKKKRIRRRSGSSEERERTRSRSRNARDRTRSRSRNARDRTRSRSGDTRDRPRSSNKQNRTPRGKKDKRERKRRSKWDVLASPVLFDPDEELEKREETRKGSSEDRDTTQNVSSEERDQKRGAKNETECEAATVKNEIECEAATVENETECEAATVKNEIECEAATVENEIECEAATVENETDCEAATVKNETDCEAATVENESEYEAATVENEIECEAATVKNEPECNETESQASAVKNEIESEEPDRTQSASIGEPDRTQSESSEEQERMRSSSSEERERKRSASSEVGDRTQAPKNETEREAVIVKKAIECNENESQAQAAINVPESQTRPAKNETESEEPGRTRSASSEERDPTRSASSEEGDPTRSPSSEEGDPTRSPSSEKRDPTRSPSSEERDPTRSASSEERDPTRSPSSEERDPTRSASSEEGDPTRSGSSEERDPTRSGSSEERDPTRSPSSEERDPTRSASSEERDQKPSASSEEQQRTQSSSSSDHVGVKAPDDAANARVDVVTPGVAGPGGLPASSQHLSSDDGKSSDDLHNLGGFTVPGTRKHAKEQPAECIESSSKKTVREDIADISNEKLSGSTSDEVIKKSEPTQSAIRCVKSEVSSTAATTVPELLDEGVGGTHIAPYHGKKSRPTITLHLSSHGATEAKKDEQKIRPVPEIRIADSSVPDNDNSGKDSLEKCASKRHRTKDGSTAKRPRIVEDVTCVEGTIFDKSAFSKKSEPSADASPAKKQKREEILEATFASDATRNTLDEKTEEIGVEVPKKQRMQQKLRHLFGKTATLSEIDEENQLISETLPKKRRKESRMSLDSGVSLSEFNSERATASPDTVSREMREHSIGRQLSAEPEEFTSIKSEEKDNDEDLFARSTAKEHSIGRQLSAEPEELISTKSEEKDVEDPFARSMPILDSQKNIGTESEDAISTQQPDSSTNFDDKSEANLSGKLTILITPMNTVGADSFAPMSLEIDVSDRSLVSTTTCTPELPVEPKSAYETCEHDDDLLKLLEMGVKKDYHITQQGNTISIQEEANGRITPLFVVAVEEDKEIAPKIADIASVVPEGDAITSQTKCGPDVGVIIANRQASTLQSQNLDDKTIYSAMELLFSDKIVDSIDSREKIAVPTSPSTTQTRDSDQGSTNVPSATCNYDLKLDDKDCYQRTVITSAKEDSQLPSTSVDSASKLEEPAIEKQFPDVGEMQKAFTDDATIKTESSDVVTIKKELSDVVDIKKELPEEENIARVEEPVTTESTDTPEQRVASPTALPATEAANPPISAPKIRLLHHSELGSRWCPTPMNGNVSSIPEAQKCPQQYQSQPSTTQIQGPINAAAPQSVNEIQSLQFMVKNVAPVQQTTNVYNLPQTQTLPNCPVEPRASTSTIVAPPTHPTSQPQSNTNRNAPISLNKVVGNVFTCLTLLHALMEASLFPLDVTQAQFDEYMNYRIIQLHHYMEILYITLGTRDNRIVVHTIFKYYPRYCRPEDMVLNVQIILNILTIKDLAVLRCAQQAQAVRAQAAPAPSAYHQTAYSANIASSQRPQNPTNSRNPVVNNSLNVQPLASTSQPEFTRPQPRRRGRAPRQSTFIKCTNGTFTKQQLKKFNEQIAAYRKIHDVQKILIQSVMARERQMMSMPAAPVPLERNLVNRQTVLLQNPGLFLQQQNQVIATQRIVYTNSTYVAVPQNISGTPQLEQRLTYVPVNLQAPPRGPICCSQPTGPVLAQDLTVQQRLSPSTGNIVFHDRTVRASNTEIPVLVQDTNFQRETRRSPVSPQNLTVQQRLSPSTGNIVFHDRTVRPSNTEIPVLVQDTNFQRETRRSPVSPQNLTVQQRLSPSTGNFVYQDRAVGASNSDIPVPVQDVNFQREMRRCPATVTSQQLRSQNFISPQHSPREMENIGAQIERRTSPSSSNQQNSPINLNVYVDRTNSAATMDNGLRLSPATSTNSTRNSEALASTICSDTWTNIQAGNGNIGVVYQKQRRSPAATTIQQSHQSNQRIPVSVDNVGASLQQQSSSAADYGVTIDNVICSIVDNIFSAGNIGHRQELPTPAASSVDLTENSTALPATNCSSIPVQIDNTYAPNQPECSAAPLIVQQVDSAQISTALPATSSSIPMQIDNTDAPKQQEDSPAASTHQQVTPQEIIACNQTDNDEDDDDDLFVLRFSPGSPTEEITTESVGCDNSTGIRLENSPASIQHSPSEEIIAGVNRADVTPQNNSGAQHESQVCPSSPGELVGDHQESARLHSPRNIAVSVVSTDVQLDQPDEHQQQEQQNAATSISGEPASGVSTIVNKLTDNGCNVRVLDVLEELDALPSMAKGKRLKSSFSRSPATKLQTKSLPLGAGGASADPIAPNDADNSATQNKYREENNCTTFQCEDESAVPCGDKSTSIVSGDSTIISSLVKSTDVQNIEDVEAAVLATYPVAVITIDDDDDEEDLESSLLEDCEALIKSEYIALQAEMEIKREMLPVCPVAAGEAEEGETESSRKIHDETAETFSILEVKSIPRDVFNNIGDGDEVELLQSSEIQETTTTDSINIKDTGLCCSRCGKLSALACSQCYSVSYCSIECHQLHWAEIHHRSCKPVPEQAQAQS